MTTMLWLGPARAVLDINDRGPSLRPGGFVLRVTNAGILGNAFYDVGLSSDPSFEFPANSGQELLNYAALWVGARTPQDNLRVSGGPILEWRPTLDPEDRVFSIEQGQPGSQRLVDDDNDGRIDEEILNGRDDDGDNEIDEDLAVVSKQMLAADYVDDRPEALSYIYEGGEAHRPLSLSVHQEVLGWATPGYDGIAGLQFRITNHGNETLRDVYCGLFVDLDSRTRSDRSGHLNDRTISVQASRTLFGGSRIALLNVGGVEGFYPITVINWSHPDTSICFIPLEQTVSGVRDDASASRLPLVGIMGLDHTTDPLARIDVASSYATAPATVQFRSTFFSRVRPPGQGGVPGLDEQRYLALAGRFPGMPDNFADDYTVLVSCGPFSTLAPGQSIDFSAALIAAATPESLAFMASNALFVQHGVTANLVPDRFGADPLLWTEGETGLTGHEACVEPPPGVTFLWDPHCPEKLIDEAGLQPPPMPQLYSHGHCIWTDADCDACTGIDGRETVIRWRDPGATPAAPSTRITPLDHAVRIEWDNISEILAAAGLAGPPGGSVVGYRIYRVSDWRERESLLPRRESWSLLAVFGPDNDHGERPLESITDTTVQSDRISYRMKHYPVGRYVFTDTRVLDGFDYVYVVTSVSDAGIESPLVASFAQRVSPQAAARSAAPGVWVVPNPYRAHAAWDRPPIGGDGLTTHLDFMGLPRARCTIKIFTLAGDLVQVLDHDGNGGDGQEAWDLVSRNGQDVESGVYLFSVESTLGHQIGRFVVIR